MKHSAQIPSAGELCVQPAFFDALQYWHGKARRALLAFGPSGGLRPARAPLPVATRRRCCLRCLNPTWAGRLKEARP